MPCRCFARRAAAASSTSHQPPACALAPVCPGEHYSVYRDLYGLDEFVPVRVAELYAATPRGVVPAIRATERDFG